MEENSRLPEIVDYLRRNPTVPPADGQHVHIHFHAAPPAPPPPPPGRTVAEHVLPWVWLGLGATIILTICAVLLAAVIVALVLGLIALAVCAVAIAYLVKTTRESQINMDLARQGRPNRRNR